MFLTFSLYLRIFPRSDKIGCVQGGTALSHLVTPCSVEVTGTLALFQREMEEQWMGGGRWSWDWEEGREERRLHSGYIYRNTEKGKKP